MSAQPLKKAKAAAKKKPVGANGNGKQSAENGAKRAEVELSEARFSRDAQVGEIRVMSFAEAAKKQTMWKGSHEVGDQTLYLLETESLRPQFYKRTISISPACMKSPDEILVNCSDQFNRTCLNTAEQGGAVTRIDFLYNSETGTISITNDGQGFPIAPASCLKDYDPSTMEGKWTVEMLLTREHAGTNDSEAGQFNGGIHGIGMKAVIADTLKTTIETVNGVTNLYYYQELHAGMTRIDPPRVIDLNDPIAADEVPSERRVPHTTITLDLDYANLCQTGEHPWFTPETSRGFAAYLETRCYQLAAYFSCLEYRYQNGERIEYRQTPRVYFNGKLLRIDNLRDFATMFPIAGGHLLRFSSYDMKYPAPWHIFIALRNEPGASDAECMSFINSVYLPEGGTHVTMMLTKIKKALIPHVAKSLKVKPETLEIKHLKPLERLIFFFDSRQAPNKGFEGQVKSKLTIGKSQLAAMSKTYEISEEDAKALWKLLGPKYLELISSKSEKEQIKETVHVKHTNLSRIKDFEPSELIGPKYAKRCIYFPCEGKTAASQVSSMMTIKGAPITRKIGSIFAGRGVPVSALKNAKPDTWGSTLDDELIGQRYKPTPKLLNNEIMKGLMAAVGLDYDAHYFNEPERAEDRDPKLAKTDPERYERIQQLKAIGRAQLETLNTLCFAIFADQDIDGTGQITTLYILIFMVFWPQLLRYHDKLPSFRDPKVLVDRYFINRVDTPLVRAYPKRKALGKVLSWYREDDFEAWIKEKYSGDLDLLEKDYKVKYYKGLGGHSKHELANMAMTLPEHIIGIRFDEAARLVATHLYGNSTVEKKKILSHRIRPEYNPELLSQNQVNFSELLMRETTAFQLDMCGRKLPSPIDGLVASQRKVLAGARKALQRGHDILVYQLTGKITDSQKYKHGDSSMNSVIIQMAQTFVGSNWIPILLPISNAFGSRRWGRDIYGQARYIYLTYNHEVMELMFPRADDLLLEYNVEDGTLVEPKYYVPVLPMSLLTTYTAPANGWKIESWARDFDTVINNVHRMIAFDYPNPAGEPIPMIGKPWLVEGMRCVVGKKGGGKVVGEICLGEYEYNPATRRLLINQMPLKLWTGVWRNGVLGLNDNKEIAAIQKGKGTKAKAGKAGGKGKAAAKAGKGKKKVAEEEPTDENEAAKDGEEPKRRIAYKPWVDKVYDETDDVASDRTHIKVILKEGAMDAINAKYQADCERLERELLTDPVEHYLELATQMRAEINMMDEFGFVKSFENYDEVMKYWFIKRRNLYVERIKRSRTLLELRVLYYENILRYIEEDSRDEKQFNIDGKDDTVRYTMLEKAGFLKFYSKPLFEPTRIGSEELRKVVLGSEASYDYIDKVNTKDKSSAGRASLARKCEEARQNLVEVRKSTWQSLWTAEIEKLVAAIRKGLKQRWEATAEKPEFEDA